MTPKEAVAKLDTLLGDRFVGGDREEDHVDADRILVEVLRGQSDELKAVAEAWERCEKRVGFWYA
jgi:hypothetical protein